MCGIFAYCSYLREKVRVISTLHMILENDGYNHYRNAISAPIVPYTASANFRH